MSTGQVIAIGALLGLAIGGLMALVTHAPFYAWVGPPAGAFYAWARRNERLDARRLVLRVGINLAFVMVVLVLLRQFIPRGP